MKSEHLTAVDARLRGPLTEKALDKLDEALDTADGEKLANICFKILHHAGVKNAEREQTPLLARQEGAQIAAASITGLLQGMRDMFSGEKEPAARAPKKTTALSDKLLTYRERQNEQEPKEPEELALHEQSRTDTVLDQDTLEELFGGEGPD
jgi:hypothetical protein